MLTTPDVGSALNAGEAERLYELAQDKIVLELGSHRGFSTLVMCQSAKQVHAVDWFRGDPHAGLESYPGFACAFLNNTAEAENLVVHIGDFKDVLPFLAPKSFGFAFVDGYHTEQATRYAGKWARRLTNGPVAFHDYGIYGVKPAVDELGGPKELVASLAIV